MHTPWRRLMPKPPLRLRCDDAPQAQPRDPENFPFIVLGNKIDEDEGRNRVVRCALC